MPQRIHLYECDAARCELPVADELFASGMQEVRVEYFRSKDFVELLKKHPGLMAGIIPEDHLVVEESRASMAAALLLRGLIVRCDRAVKTIRQGRKKLSKWPAKLEVHAVTQPAIPATALLT